MYTPPFEITSEIIDLISAVSEKIGEINAIESSPNHVQLRKDNRIKTIHASLAIENNSLSIEQIIAIIEGKRVLGNPNEIREVKNAVQAYELMLTLCPYEQEDLLKAHGLMMQDLVDHSGQYRSGGVGVFDGDRVVHLAPPASRIPALMDDLFAWLKTSNVHPLIKSCVFHYEFEFIHPFQDGNGRIGRLWQTVILKEWKKVFAWLPVETLIKENQEAYYRILGICDSKGDSTDFIAFMLSVILKALEEIAKSQEEVTDRVTEKVTEKVTENQRKILDSIRQNPHVTQETLAEMIGLSRKSISDNMKKLREMGLIQRIGSDRKGYWAITENMD